jgi:hypothetical protein
MRMTLRSPSMNVPALVMSAILLSPVYLVLLRTALQSPFGEPADLRLFRERPGDYMPDTMILLRALPDC